MRSGYPSVPFVSLPVKTWADSYTREYIDERLTLHFINPPAVCTPEERWEKPAKFAVMKGSNKRAVKLHDSMAEANKHMDNANAKVKGHWVEHRPGTDTRCVDYCPVKQFCWYAQEKGYNE
jgi:hypothetical protein